MAVLLDRFTQLTSFSLAGCYCNGQFNVELATFLEGRINGGWPQLTELRLDDIRFSDSPPTLPATLRKLALTDIWREEQLAVLY